MLVAEVVSISVLEDCTIEVADDCTIGVLDDCMTGVLDDGGTTIVLVAMMTVVTQSSDAVESSRACDELVRLILALEASSLRLRSSELEKMSDGVWRFVVPVLLKSPLLDDWSDRLELIEDDCRITGAFVGGGGA